VSLALPLWLGGLSFGRRDGLAALVFWLLGLACWAALRPRSWSSTQPAH
jgi:hypothetical protein